jgi:hypothetical protein
MRGGELRPGRDRGARTLWDHGERCLTRRRPDRLAAPKIRPSGGQDLSPEENRYSGRHCLRGRLPGLRAGGLDYGTGSLCRRGKPDVTPGGFWFPAGEVTSLSRPAPIRPWIVALREKEIPIPKMSDLDQVPIAISLP